MSDDTLTPKKGTLSAKTLTAGPRSGTSRGGGVSVEVRRRRFGAADQPTRTAASVDGDSEMARRLRALEEAKSNAEAEEKRRSEERENAAMLQEAQSKSVEERRRVETEIEERKAAEAAEKKAAKEAEKAAAEAEANQPDQPPLPPSEKQAPRSMAGAEHKKVTAAAFKKKAPAAGKPGERDTGKKRGRNAYMDDLEQRYRTISPRRKGKGGGRGNVATAAPKEKVFHEVAIPEFITVQELSARMAEKVGDVVKNLMMMGQMVTATQSIDQETAALIVEEMGHTYRLESETDIEIGLAEDEDDAKDLKERAPVVTVMGHVDHGKTSLLDALRSSRVAAGEAGGITQHIGAYQVESKSGRRITFLDTPGHAAFTSMRARGAQVTDVVILVVAADDSVMPQTIEAIKHAKEAGVPIVVAINKIDKPEANVDKVKQDLLSHDLIPEDFGGDIVTVPISAKTGEGLDVLEEMVLLQADVLDLKANPSRRADGVIVESELDKGRGPVATVIVQRGTLKQGDILVAGSVYGRVRALISDTGEQVKEAGPATPVEVLGLQSAPEAGETFLAVENDKRAREVADFRKEKKREQQQAAQAAGLSLDNIFNRIAEGGMQELPVVVKADVQGSVEAITEALNKMETNEVKIRVIHGAVGVVTESDVMLAAASSALIVGFNMRADATARKAAEAEGIEIRYYSVIYELLDEVKAALSGLLSPDFVEETTGHAEVRQVFSIGKAKIAGCYVTDGMLERNSKARLIRDGKVIIDTTIETIRREKNDVKEIKESFECGISLEGFDDIVEGDVIEAYVVKEVEKNFDDVVKSEKIKAKKDAEEAKQRKEEEELAALEAEIAEEESAAS